MVTVGIDIGGRSHAVARCRQGMARADRGHRVSQSRAGVRFARCWLERQPEPVALVTLESSGHYWMPLTSHLRRRDVPVAVVNPLAAKYARRPPGSPTRPMPGAWQMGMRDHPIVRDPLAGAELRQAAVSRWPSSPSRPRSASASSGSSSGFPSSASCSTTRPAGRLGGFSGSRQRRGCNPTPDVDARRRECRAWTSTAGQAKAERLQAAAAGRNRGARARRRGRLRGRPAARSARLARASIEAADRHVASLLDSETTRRLQTIRASGRQSRRPSSRRSATSTGSPTSTSCSPRRHPSGRAELRAEGLEPRDRLAHVQAGNSHLRAAAYRMAVVGVRTIPSSPPITRASERRASQR